MRLARQLILLFLTGACVFLLVGFAFGMADKPAIVITPSGSPVWLDSQRSLFIEPPSVSVGWRNESGQTLNYSLRIWIFDERSRLKATLDHCTYDQLGTNTRGRTLVPLPIPGVTLRDRVVVTVLSAGSGTAVWTLRETESSQLNAARAAARGSGGRLSLARSTSKEAAGWNCPCDCAAIQSACDQVCGTTGRASATCERTLDSGCSASCTCK